MIEDHKEDCLPLEIDLQADRGGTTPERTTAEALPAGTLDSTQGRRVETTPEERVDMRKDIVTLAMVGDAEGAARRP